MPKKGGFKRYRKKVVSFPYQGMGYHGAQNNRPGDFELQSLSLINARRMRTRVIIVTLCVCVCV